MTALAADEPVMVPIRPEATTAILAGPPRAPPATALAMFSIACPPPEACSTAAKTTKGKM